MVFHPEESVPNIEVLAGTPQPDEERPPRRTESLHPLYYGQYQPFQTILQDGTADLRYLIEEGEGFGKTLVRGITYQDPHASTSTLWASAQEDAEPYRVKYLAGTQDTKLARDNAKQKLDGMPSFTFIPSTRSCISTPYWPTEEFWRRNGVEGQTSPLQAMYRWVEVDRDLEETENSPGVTIVEGLAVVNLMEVTPEGVIRVTPQSRDRKRPNKIMLPVVKDELWTASGASLLDYAEWTLAEEAGFHSVPDEPQQVANDQVNAFSLALNVQPGCDDEQNEKREWSITVKFGECTVLIRENTNTVRFSYAGGRSFDLEMDENTGTRTTSHRGTRPFFLTFIPVWNGVLVSDFPPSSSNVFSANVQHAKFLPKNPKAFAFDEIQRNWDEPENNDSAGPQPPAPPPLPPPLPPGVFPLPPPDENPFPTEDDVNQKGFPRKLPKATYGRNINPREPGVEHRRAVEFRQNDANIVDFKDKIEVEWSRCGGTIQFIPVFFPQISRTHFIQRGEALEEGEEFSENLEYENRSVKDMQQPPEHRILPIVFNTRRYEWYSAAKIFPGPTDAPYWSVMMELKRGGRNENTNTYSLDSFYRRPIECWGAFAYRLSDPDREPEFLRLKNEDGFLTVNDVDVRKIKSVSIQRGFDGTSGTLVWDRYDPDLGLINRPNQNVGSLQLAIRGGADTRPGGTRAGVIYTGIVQGNAEVNTGMSNDISLQLSGREAKLVDDGGMRLLNQPFFDGYDHREVMQYLCDWGGIPFHNLADTYYLPSGVIQAPVVNFQAGTTVWDAISTVCKLSSCIAYLDRFGKLRYIEAFRTTGINWNYPETRVTSFNDTPDFSAMRDSIVLSALIYEQAQSAERPYEGSLGDRTGPEIGQQHLGSPVFMLIKVDTDPVFPWSKMMHYAINGVIRSQAEFNRIAAQIAAGVARPRATGTVSVPGNADVELLDTFNDDWVITSISHNIDTQSKSWTTDLSLELILKPQVSAQASLLPIQSLG